jgi:hypothetical protein
MERDRKMVTFRRSIFESGPMKVLYRAAEISVLIARVLTAMLYAAIAILLFVLALWLALPIGQSWLLSAIAALVGLIGFAILVKASEIFLTTRSPERNIGFDSGNSLRAEREKGRSARSGPMS